MNMIIKKRVAGVLMPVFSGLLALCVLLPSGCTKDGTSSGGKLKVAVSIAPLADFCRRVGEDRVEVELMVPSGASPHTFEPTTAQMKFLSEARLLVLNGLELEAWAADILGKVGNSGLVRVEAAAAIPESELIPAGGEGHGDEGEEAGHRGEHGIYDPHVWLDPVLAAYQVEAIRDALVEADPQHAQEYRDNAAAYIEKLDALDTWVRGQVDSFTRKRFVAFHSSWTYFARRYGLEMAGVVEELPGKEPGAARIAELVEVIRAQGVTVIFAEPQFSPRAAEAIAGSSGGQVLVAILDPLGSPDDPVVNTYVNLIHHDVEVMGEALK